MGVNLYYLPPLDAPPFRSSAMAMNCSRALQVFDDAGGQRAGGWQVVGVFEAFVTQPEEIEAQLIAFEQVIVAEGVETLVFLALVAVLGVVAGHEIVEVGACEGIGAQGEVLVGAQVVDPQAFGPVRGAGGFLIEEEYVGFDALGIEDARWQTQQRMHRSEE